jgi:hypothetical protein
MQAIGVSHFRRGATLRDLGSVPLEGFPELGQDGSIFMVFGSETYGVRDVHLNIS